MNGQKLTILYERLSRDDPDTLGESNSIANQRRMLEDYAERNGFTPFSHLTDDGYTGTNFERPGWQELLTKIESGEIGTIIIKNLDRMGRNYLQTGMYREMFKERGIRLIAIHDGIDTFEREDDFTPFREIMAEYYARDTSRKVKAVLSSKGKSGKPLTSTPIYGFSRNPNDKSNWQIDDEAAAVIRRMYALTIDGIGPYAIAKILADDKVMKPSAYFAEKGLPVPGAKSNDDPYSWRGQVVAQFIAKPEYAGHTVNFRTAVKSYKDKRRECFSPENWLVFENTHPAIVDQSTWDTAQRLRTTKRRTDSVGEPNPLTGLLYCGLCGERMYNSRSQTPKPQVRLNGDLYQPPPRDSYMCSTYQNAKHIRHDKCVSNAIRSVVVREILLDVIRSTVAYVRDNESEFLQRIRELSTVQQNETAKSHKKKLAKNERRLNELKMIFKRTYEDNIIGKLSDETYAELSAEYERERAELTAQHSKMQSELDAFENDGVRAENFLELARKFTEFEELTPAMLNEFIRRIVKVNISLHVTGKKVAVCWLT
jgi:DNA invertase Pin-like site-specific DNA recombinase